MQACASVGVGLPFQGGAITTPPPPGLILAITYDSIAVDMFLCSLDNFVLVSFVASAVTSVTLLRLQGMSF